jgi:S1-C subfamily serine protease
MKLLFVSLSLFFAFSLVNCAEQQIERKISVQAYDAEANGFGIIISDIEESEEDVPGTGVKILEIIDDSNAARAGLKADDVIVAFNGKKVGDAESLNDLAEDFDEDSAEFTFLRDGQEQKVKIDKGPYKSDKVQVLVDGKNNVDVDFLMPGRFRYETQFHGKSKGGFMGVNLDDISDQMKDYFEVTNGALIESVIKESAAEAAGLKAGDVIFRINDRKIEDVEDVLRTVNYYNPGETISVNVVRKGSKKTFKVTLKERSHSSNGHNSVFVFADDEADAGVLRKRVRKELKDIKWKMKEMKDDLKVMELDIKIYII